MPASLAWTLSIVTLNAHLNRIHLLSPQPEAMAAFYARAYGMAVQEGLGVQAQALACVGPGRRVDISPGPANRLGHALFVFQDAADHERFARHAQALAPWERLEGPGWPQGCVQVLDPDGHRMVFGLASAGQADQALASAGVPAAMSQHFALRTQRIVEMLAFYEGVLGFTVSDRVLDNQQQVRAVFLRCNELHHCLALFAAPVTCFDHQSFETPSWNDLKHWADHMSAQRIPIDWGVGRHGPGNDVFFMVRDPDGNLAEISSEIEVCQPGRPVGLWKNEERTLNLWGRAIMRS